jgi:TRAP-type C4-dicarboxylate transport system substrate-binding protein
MRKSKSIFRLLFFSLLIVSFLLTSLAFAKKKNPLAAWKAKFDARKAKYYFKVSNVSHPVIQGIRAGYRIRDQLWEKSNGQLGMKYYPLSQLGGEVEVFNMLQTGTVQGMSISSVAAANFGPRMGIVNLPFVINTFKKLDAFAANKELFQPFLDAMKDKGIMGVDITGYGSYGWASKKPIHTIADAKKVRFRIAEAPVQKDIYAAWGLHPVVMPWPDVPVALKQGVIEGLDHTPMVCWITKKFEICKYYTFVNYAQGLFIWIFNQKWFNKLPADLQKLFLNVVHSECANTRKLTKQQEDDSIAAAKKAGITFIKMAPSEYAKLKKMSEKVYKRWSPIIGQKYFNKVKAYMDKLD